MVYDNIKNYKLYANSERFEKAFEFLLSAKDKAPGKYAVCDGVTANVQESVTHPISERKTETHKRHADIQYVIEGLELFGVSLEENLELAEPYDPVRDNEKYTSKDVTLLPLLPGYFALVYPHDVHMSLVGDGQTVRKIVMKVLLDD